MGGPYSMTLSARRRSVGEIVIPIAFAVFKLLAYRRPADSLERHSPKRVGEQVPSVARRVGALTMRQFLKLPSDAVATSREDHLPPTSGQADQHRPWDLERRPDPNDDGDGGACDPRTL